MAETMINALGLEITMRTFAQNQNNLQRKGLIDLGRSRPMTSIRRYHTPLSLNLQRTVGNHDVRRLQNENSEELETNAGSTIAVGFGHDFSRVPTHATAPTKPQTKLKVSTPTDTSEQEADWVAERVMRMPEPQLQTKCACGGGCLRCQNGQASHKQLQTNRAQAVGSMQIGLSPIVQKALQSAGQPLDSSTRRHMEPRFDHDFSQVRVYTDARAADAASAIAARAFTINRDIVFGSGEYAPQTESGRWLLSHELAHVIQQRSLVQRKESTEAPVSTTEPSLELQDSGQHYDCRHKMVIDKVTYCFHYESRV